MNLKKIFKFFSFIFVMLIGIIFGTSKVNAVASRGDIISGKYLSGPYYVMHEKPSGSHMWLQAQFIIRSSDGQFVYCVQPYVTIKEDNSYNVTTDDIVSVTNISSENWDKIAKIAYYGYGYKDANHDHTSDKWYIAAQMLIWNLADPNIDSYFTNTLKGTRNDSILKSEQEEIMSLVNNHLVTPNLINIPNSMNIGQTITVNDGNNVLNNYSIENVQNGNVTKNGNSLSITATGVGTLSFNMNKNNNIYGNPIQLYYAIDSQNVMRRGDLDPIAIKKNITVYGGKVEIHKVDSETKTCKAQGDSSLVGAKYGVYDHEGNLVDTIITGNDCTATSKDLPYGRYTVKEITPSEGYYLDKNNYSINVTNNNLITITSYEDVIKNYISILKQYDYVDGQTTFLNAEANITFEIFNSKGEKYSTITTDKNGYASINLPYGVWKLHQVNSTTGYDKIYDFYVTVNRESNLEQYYNILNNAISAYLQVFKVDSETGNKIALANTTFKILNMDTNQYVSQYVGGKVYSEFKTDEEGKMITYLKLQSGNYKIIEVSSPKGYLINPEGYFFTIGDNTYFNYTTYGAFITLEYKNTPIKGQIEIRKQGEKFVAENGTYEYQNTKLDKIKFEVYAKEDILSSDGNYLYYNKGDLVDTLITDKDGYAISKKLPLGKYYVVEVETKDNYILDTTEHDIELKEIDNKTSVVYITLKLNNKLKKGDLEFTKTDLTTSKGIKDTKVEIYTENDELIFTGKTDKDGKITIKALSIGKYYIIETEASTGYKITNEKVLFEIKENGEIVKANMTNEKITGTLEFTKTDYSTDEPLPNTVIEIYTENDELVFTGKTNENGNIVIEKLEYGKYYILEKEAPEGYVLNTEKMYFEILEDGEVIKSKMKNKLIESTIKIHKVDEKENSLAGVLIGIYDLDDNLIYSALTDEDGYIEYKLSYGKYYFQEIETIEGYTLTDEKVYFEITKDGEVIQHTLVNDSIIKVPNTEENNYIIPISIILVCGATVIIIYDKIKRRKK